MTKDRDYHARDPHFDGKREGIISDPGGKQIGIVMDTDDTSKESANPFNVSELKKDPALKKFDQTFK